MGLEGDFVWHSRAATGEGVLRGQGALRIDFQGEAVDLSAGVLLVLAAGVVQQVQPRRSEGELGETAWREEHRRQGGDRTAAKPDVWIGRTLLSGGGSRVPRCVFARGRAAFSFGFAATIGAPRGRHARSVHPGPEDRTSSRHLPGTGGQPARRLPNASRFCRLLALTLHYEYFDELDPLKHAYFHFDPA